MKTFLHISPQFFLPVILLVTLLISCIAEPVAVDGYGQEVKITFRTGTRSEEGSGTHPGDAEDRHINSFRVLGYSVSNGKLAFNEVVEDIYGQDLEEFEAEITVKTGRYTVIFIANEHSDQETEELLEGISEEENNTLVYLKKNVTFSHTAFSSDNNIPMVTIKENVVIQGKNQLIDNGDPINGKWDVSMERLGVRIDFALKLSDGQSVAEDTKLQFSNVPAKVYLFKGESNDSNETGYYKTITSPSSYTIDIDNDGALAWERIILPESMFSDKSNKEKGVEIGLKLENDDYTYTAVIGLDADNTVESERDYTLPRNTYFNITATANPSSQILDCSAKVTPWNEAKQEVIVDGQYWLKVSKDELTFPDSGGEATITATTNYYTTSQGYQAGIQVKEEDIEYIPAGTPWITLSVNTSNVTITAAENSGAYRTAKIKVKAGNMTKIINVMQSIAPDFARSNIVMFKDDSGKKILTFAETAEDHTTAKRVQFDVSTTVSVPAIPANVQGLHFRWGSLVGVTCDHIKDNGSTLFEQGHVVFSPIEYTKPETWVFSSTTETGQIPWITVGEIPDQTTPIDYTKDVFDGYNVTGFDKNNAKGDICRYITAQGWVEGNWRMPTYAEYKKLEVESYNSIGVIHGAFDDTYELVSNTGDGGKYGYYQIPDVRIFGAGAHPDDGPSHLQNPGSARVVLPASGYRNNGNGSLMNPGYIGSYWSTTPTLSQGYSYYFYFKGDEVKLTTNNRHYGRSVRCIKV